MRAATAGRGRDGAGAAVHRGRRLYYPTWDELQGRRRAPLGRRNFRGRPLQGTAPDGSPVEQDGYEAMWEAHAGLTLVYAEQRYADVVVMKSGACAWRSDPRQPGVEVRTLGGAGHRAVRRHHSPVRRRRVTGVGRALRVRRRHANASSTPRWRSSRASATSRRPSRTSSTPERPRRIPADRAFCQHPSAASHVRVPHRAIDGQRSRIWLMACKVRSGYGRPSWNVWAMTVRAPRSSACTRPPNVSRP